MKRTIPVSPGDSLQSIIDQAVEAGVTDLSKVVLDGDYVGGCCGGHEEGEYCYAESGYTDLRFEYQGKQIKP